MTRKVQVWIEPDTVALYYYIGVTKVKWTRRWLEVTYEGGMAKIMVKAILAFQDDLIELGP